MTKHVAYLQVVPKLEIVHLWDSNCFFLSGFEGKDLKRGMWLQQKYQATDVFDIHHIYIYLVIYKYGYQLICIDACKPSILDIFILITLRIGLYGKTWANMQISSLILGPACHGLRIACDDKKTKWHNIKNCPHGRDAFFLRPFKLRNLRNLQRDQDVPSYCSSDIVGTSWTANTSA